jgi:hypothetical protein
VAAVTISPDPPIDTDTLICTYTGFSDADDDIDSSTLQWTVNGADAGTTSTLSASIEVDDFVTCTVIPSDRFTTGPGQTASVRIGASTESGDGESGGTDGSGTDDTDAEEEEDITLASADYEFVGEGSGDQSGYSVANAGDVDGDGLDDILVGAFSNDDGGDSAGKTYLFYGKTLGDRTRINLSRADYSFVGDSSGDYSAWSVASAGDVDGDGRADILIGAIYDDRGPSNSGTAYLILASSLSSGDGPDGRIEHTMDLGAADYKFTGTSTSHYSGSKVASAGDIDGDGLDDIMIGAIHSPSYCCDSRGQVYIVLARSLGDPSTRSLSSADYIIDGENAYDYLGSAMASAGDVDGDGKAEILIGAYGNDEVGSNAGMTYLLLGSSFGDDTRIYLSDASYRISGAYGSDTSGYSVAGGGDIDGDGLSDVLIGAQANPDGGMYAGSVYVIFGNRFGDEQDLDLYLDADYQLIGENDFDYVGRSVANAGDVDGDGLDDIVVGSYELAGTHPPIRSGGIYIFLARDLGPVVPISLADADQKIVGEESSDYAGYSVSGGGDVNGDGLSDIIVGAYQAESGGMTYLLFGE